MQPAGVNDDPAACRGPYAEPRRCGAAAALEGSASAGEMDTDLSNVYGEDSRAELAGVQGLDPDGLGGSWASLRGCLARRRRR